MDLKDLMVDSKSVWLDFPECPGFEIEIANLSRKELISLRKNCTTNKMDRQTRQYIETVDEAKFVKQFTQKIIKNWKGFKLKYLESLVLVDLGDNDPDEELPFTLENAEHLVENSTEFDGWVNEVAFDLDTFRTRTS